MDARAIAAGRGDPAPGPVHARPAARDRTRAAILVAVLVTGMVLLMVALAGGTLALLHLRAATYAERAQRARIEARSGLELLDALLARRRQETGRLPSVAPDLPTGHGLDLRIVGYRRAGDDVVEIEVEARADGAVATAGARFRYP